MDVTYYAGAADAAGTAHVRLDAGELSVDQLRRRLGEGNERLAAVLACCSLMVDGSVVHDGSGRVPASARVDVLPPFAGG